MFKRIAARRPETMHADTTKVPELSSDAALMRITTCRHISNLVSMRARDGQELSGVACQDA